MSKMKKKVKALIDRLRYEGGFCDISDESVNKIIAKNTLEADEFACAIMEAEGMDPIIDNNWRKNLRNMFINEFGCREINHIEFENDLL